MIKFVNKYLLWHVVLFMSATCQSGYVKSIPVSGSLSSNIDDIEFSEDALILRGNVLNDSTKLWGLSLLKIDTTGSVITFETFFDSVSNRHIVVNSPSRFIRDDENKYLIPAYFFNSKTIVLFIIDSLGNEISRNEYINTERSLFPKGILSVNSSIYIFGTAQRINYFQDVFIIKTDSTGKFVWIKYYGDSTDEIFGDVQVDETGIITIAAQILLSVDKQKPWIFSVDTSGSIVNNWKGNINDIRTKGGGPFFKLDNGDFVIASLETKEVTYAGATHLFNGPTISKLDRNFNLIWKDTLANFTSEWDGLVDLEYDSKRDEFVVAGHRTVIYNSLFAAVEAWVVKFNSNGEIVWSVSDTLVSDSVNGAWLFSSGLVISSSGSIYIAGNFEYYTNPTRYCGFVMKVTQDGCMDTICTTTSIEDQLYPRKKVNIVVRPNPVTDEMNIDIKELNGEAVLKMYEPGGRQVLTTTVYQGVNALPINLPQGLYFYSIYNSKRIIGSGKVIVR